ncbi:unnamed protein product, partial [Amoebophrya sp. A120]|eukprot:GSA120T00024238001.1
MPDPDPDSSPPSGYLLRRAGAKGGVGGCTRLDFPDQVAPAPDAASSSRRPIYAPRSGLEGYTRQDPRPYKRRARTSRHGLRRLQTEQLERRALFLAAIRAKGRPRPLLGGGSLAPPLACGAVTAKGRALGLVAATSRTAPSWPLGQGTPVGVSFPRPCHIPGSRLRLAPQPAAAGSSRANGRGPGFTCVVGPSVCRFLVRRPAFSTAPTLQWRDGAEKNLPQPVS